MINDDGRSVDLPVFRLSTLLALNPSRLVFPGVSRGGGSRTNLLLVNLADPVVQGEATPLALEVRDADGFLRGYRILDLGPGEQRFIGDIAGYLGADTLTDGQLRVLRLGDSPFWAIMPIVRADGSLSISLGTMP